MSVIKLNELKNNSEKIKKLFIKTMSSRKKYIQTIQFSNDELLDILKISEEYEKHKNRNEFYQLLIIYQKGPFNNDVFSKYIHKLNQIDPLISLIEKTNNLSIENKKIWIKKIIAVSSNWAISQFLSKNKGLEYGIDILTSPFNFLYASEIVSIIAHRLSISTNSSEYMNELKKILNTMDEMTIFLLYRKNIKDNEKIKQAFYYIIMNYDKMPKSVIKDYWQQIDINEKSEIVFHPNCPNELRNELFNITNNDKFLPEEAREIFIF